MWNHSFTEIPLNDKKQIGTCIAAAKDVTRKADCNKPVLPQAFIDENDMDVLFARPDSTAKTLQPETTTTTTTTTTTPPAFTKN